MLRDVNTKKVMKNAYRITKNKYETSLRVRIPGGCVDPESLMIVSTIANEFGNGQIHITTRQGFEILGIKMEDMETVNKIIQPVIEKMDINQEVKDGGYPAAGTRNVCACIGNKVCPKAQYNTTEFAKKMEKSIFPNDLHFKVAFTGCPNDCIKARTHDFGIIGMTLPLYDKDRCVSCGACVKKCEKLSTGALKMENNKIVARTHDFGIIGMTLPLYDKDRCVSCGACVKKCEKLSTGALKMENNKIVRDHDKCIGCGECTLNCPTSAWTRDEKKYYRLAIMGRTGLKMENNKIVRDHDKCIGCGECTLNCPTSAWTRDEKKYYRLAIMGRTGKKNPRLAEDFLIWADEESIIKIVLNTYKFVKEYIDLNAPGGKEHIGYIIDRTGFMEYKKWALEGVEFADIVKVNENIYWSGIKY